MHHDLQQTVALLTRTPATLNALLRDLPGTWTLHNEGEGTWSVSDVIQHLVHCERTDWMTRAKLIRDSGESRTFDPLDRTAHLQASLPRTLDQSLDEFASLRTANLAELHAMDLRPEDLALCGRHPAFGAVTLSQLLATWPVHDLTHLHQISRIMAHQYRNTVGPWSAYLGVLQCNGHSATA
jgi:uncharacterized damage-inducible protein DinB